MVSKDEFWGQQSRKPSKSKVMWSQYIFFMRHLAKLLSTFVTGKHFLKYWRNSYKCLFSRAPRKFKQYDGFGYYAAWFWIRRSRKFCTLWIVASVVSFSEGTTREADWWKIGHLSQLVL
jgi:hypothetical protein